LTGDKDIPTTASEAGQFGTLLAAAKAAGLVEALSGEGPLTVFAPTDEAFAKLPEGTVASLLKPENRSKLATILKYHVVPGRIYSTDALEAGKATTLQGDAIEIMVKNGTAMVNSAKLISTDIDASNGVIHVIDSVILPPEKQSSVHPRRMIEMAINEGAPMFNEGHVDACAQIYMNTVRELLTNASGSLGCSTKSTLQHALHTAQATSSASSQAWTLRRALDVAHAQM